MSLTKRIKQGFLRTPLAQKAILAGSALLMLSPLFPWFDSRNASNIGETSIGLKGPLFLVGILVMVFGAISFFNLFFPLMGRNFFKLRRRSGLVAMVLSAQSLFLLAVANSVFFHPSFGSNASLKGTRFGLMIAFVGIGVMFVAGYLTYRKEKSGEYEELESMLTNPELEPEPVAADPEPEYQHVAIHEEVQSAVRPLTSPYSRPSGAYQGDPLLLDPKTRYKMMRSEARRVQTSESQTNLWGGEVNQGSRIRTDL